MSSTCESPVQILYDGLSLASSLPASKETAPELLGNTFYQENLINYIRNSVRCETNNQRVTQQLQKKRQLILEQQRQKRQKNNCIVSAAEVGMGSVCSDNTDVDHFDDFDSEEEVTCVSTGVEVENESTKGERGASIAKNQEVVDALDVRKERNRMHAKLTRSRKKLFTNKIVQMISSLEQQNKIMRSRIRLMEEKRDCKGEK